MACLNWTAHELLVRPSLRALTARATMLKQDRQSWLLEEPCLHPDLVVTLYDMSMQGLYCLPVQGWDCQCEDAAVRRLCGTSADPALHGRRASW